MRKIFSAVRTDCAGVDKITRRRLHVACLPIVVHSHVSFPIAFKEAQDSCDITIAKPVLKFSRRIASAIVTSQLS